MTWNNRPNKSECIERLDFYYQEEDDDDLFFLIDVSDYIKDNDTSISICINASIIRTEDNYAIIYSKEYHLNRLKPRLYWSYYVPDIYPPYIQIYPPQDDQTFGETAPTFTINQLNDDSTIVSMWYTIDNDLTNHTFTSFTQRVNQADWDKQPDGEVIIRAYAKDIRGNIGCGTRRVWKDTSESATEPNNSITELLLGLSLLVGVMALGFIGRYVFKKKKT